MSLYIETAFNRHTSFSQDNQEAHMPILLIAVVYIGILEFILIFFNLVLEEWKAMAPGFVVLN